jgi:hypothetical protein
MQESDVMVFALILVVMWWIFGSIAVGVAAQKRGRSGGAWFGMSIALGPILAVLLLLAYPSVTEAERNGEEPTLSILGNKT